MARLVAAHQLEQLADVRVAASLLHLCVENAAGKLRRQRTDQKVYELPRGLPRRFYCPRTLPEATFGREEKHPKSNIFRVRL